MSLGRPEKGGNRPGDRQMSLVGLEKGRNGPGNRQMGIGRPEKGINGPGNSRGDRQKGSVDKRQMKPPYPGRLNNNAS